MKNTMSIVVAAAVAVTLGLAACRSTPGPVQPTVGSKAPGVLVIEPALLPWLDIPNGEQNYSYNKLNLLEYNTVVRNKGNRAMTLSGTVYFNNEAGQLVEQQPIPRFIVDGNSEAPLQVAANNKDARTMRLQIRLAK